MTKCVQLRRHLYSPESAVPVRPRRSNMSERKTVWERRNKTAKVLRCGRVHRAHGWIDLSKVRADDVTYKGAQSRYLLPCSFVISPGHGLKCTLLKHTQTHHLTKNYECTKTPPKKTVNENEDCGILFVLVLYCNWNVCGGTSHCLQFETMDYSMPLTYAILTSGCFFYSSS